VERLLQLAHLKILASQRGVTTIETREDRLMLTRRGDFVTVGGKFPRLRSPDPEGRLEEIQRVLQVL
jgi:transcription-repair coupling factor (superfamily II helicase)